MTDLDKPKGSWYTRVLPNTMTKATFRRLAALSLVALFSACNPPKYAKYESLNKDYIVSVPWGWQVMTDQQDDVFTQATFIGPFDGDFYLGAPSLTVRWFKRYRPHRLQDGRLEMYSSADDFIKQMLAEVYGPDYVIFDQHEKLSYQTNADGTAGSVVIPEITLKNSGLKAKYFTVLSATPAPENMQWGVSEQSGSGKPHILRRHTYVIVPMPSGFYVMTYPATSRGYEHYVDRFRGLIGSFIPRTDGPGGAKYKIPGPGAS